jgi:hypothetical protein
MDIQELPIEVPAGALQHDPDETDRRAEAGGRAIVVNDNKSPRESSTRPPATGSPRMPRAAGVQRHYSTFTTRMLSRWKIVLS